jgi:hypothetical protein
MEENTETLQRMNREAALAWIDWWYSTPDDKPPGYWEELEAEILGHPLTFTRGREQP